jgi:hypothetical protein
MRVNTVKKSRKSPGKCQRCGRTIEKGEGYRWVQEYRGAKRCFCNDCELRASDTTSGRLGQVYAAMESGYDALNSWAVDENRDADGLRDAVQCLNEQLEELRDEYQEAAEAIEENFPGSDQACQLEESASGMDDWCSQIADVVSELEDGFDEDEDEDETDAQRDKRREQWLEEKLDDAQRALDECPL